jgi:hypothetical protein
MSKATQVLVVLDGPEVVGVKSTDPSVEVYIQQNDPFAVGIDDQAARRLIADGEIFKNDGHIYTICSEEVEKLEDGAIDRLRGYAVKSIDELSRPLAVDPRGTLPPPPKVPPVPTNDYAPR